MKKMIFVLALVFSVIGYYACNKSVPDNYACTSKPAVQDTAALIRYAGDSITLSYSDSSGLLWHIIDSGNSTHPSAASVMRVTYVGRLMNNTIFDSASNTNLNGAALYNLILGWQFGMPKIGVGGRILLFIPSQLAWGCTGYGPVGPDQPVFFDVSLLGVN